MSRCGLVRASVVAGLALSMAGPVRAQSSPTASDGPAGEATPTKTQAGALPVSLDRIRAALEAAPESRLKLPDRPTFSIEVEGHPPRIEDFLDPAELRRGPAMPMAMTHQEFLAVVTPPEARQFGAFSADELAVVAATSLATGLALGTLPSLIKDTLRRRQESQAKREVAEILAELERQKAQEPRDE